MTIDAILSNSWRSSLLVALSPSNHLLLRTDRGSCRQWKIGGRIIWCGAREGGASCIYCHQWMYFFERKSRKRGAGHLDGTRGHCIFNIH